MKTKEFWVNHGIAMTIQTYKKAHDPTDNQLRLAVGSLVPAIASVGKDQQILR